METRASTRATGRPRRSRRRRVPLATLPPEPRVPMETTAAAVSAVTLTEPGSDPPRHGIDVIVAVPLPVSTTSGTVRAELARGGRDTPVTLGARVATSWADRALVPTGPKAI